MDRAVLAALIAPLLAACSAPPSPAMPDGAGRGIVHADAAPPPGATTWPRPAWTAGDRFVLVRGERLRGGFTVRAVTDTHYAIDAGNGLELRRDLDLGNLGEWTASGEPLHLLSPADTRFHWPLWVGKRWSCEFADRARGGASLPVRADYVVEDLDTITVPAGTFEALRIVRSLRRLDAPADFLTRWQVIWYAPAAGIEVRQLVGDTVVELAERGRAP